MITNKEIKLVVDTDGYSPMNIGDKINASLTIMTALDEIVTRFDEDSVEITISIKAKGNC